MRGGRTFLLEVGCEEIPAPMVPRALDDLTGRILEALGGPDKLGGWADSPPPFGGPRRLVAYIQDVREREEDRTALVTGPPVAAAFDAQGSPTKAALGFAKSHGVPVERLERIQGDKGEVIGLRRKIEGRTAASVLAEACPKVLMAMRFPKMMKWGDRGHCFVRPVHWIVALLDSELIEMEFMGIRSGRKSHGHRFLSPGPHEIPSAAEYEKVLDKAGHLIVRSSKRREKIVQERERAAARLGWRTEEDGDLLEELTFLVEHPHVIAGRVSEEFLSLEEPFVVTPMKHHQKYFPAYLEDGNLAPGFLAVTNTGDPSGVIRRGNEWVLRARLADAKFFREEDQRKSLHQRDQDLSRIAFHGKLGNYLQRSQRLEALAAWLAAALGLDPAESEICARAARLSKADLTTGMVGEFPELQGITGGLYLRAEGGPQAEPIARAVESHYMQAPPDVERPEAPGMVVAVADKMDLLVGCFAAGLIPKGSADPYGLRRAALGICRILSEGKGLGAFPVRGAAEKGRGLYVEQGLLPESAAEAIEPVMEFLAARLRFLMEEEGIRYDTARAVLASGWWDDVPGAWLRARQLDHLRNLEGGQDFSSLATSAKRIRNILAQAREKGVAFDEMEVRAKHLVEREEKELHSAIKRVSGEVKQRTREGEYRIALQQIASLRPSVDRFFDKVLVMAPEADLRRNRLSLLDSLSGLLSEVADFSQIVVEGERPEEGK